MKKTIQRHLLSTLASVAVLIFGLVTPASGATWTGGSTVTNGWSDSANWDTFVVPGAFDAVIFGATGVTNVTGAINNVVDQPFQISSLNYSTLTTSGFHTTSIDAGMSLNINGTGGDALFVGTGVSAITGQNVYDRFVGPGTLSVTNTTGLLRVMQFGDNTDHRATLDLSGLTNFAADVSQVLIGTTLTTAEERIQASLFLAENSFIRTAAGVTKPGLLVGSMANGSTGIRGTQELQLRSNTTIHSDGIAIGGYKMTGAMTARSGVSNGVVTLRGSAGGSDRVKILSIGDQRAGPDSYVRGNTSAAVSGTLNPSPLAVDALVTDLYVARSQTNSSGVSTGVLTFDQGTIDADNVYVGFHPSPAAGNAAFNSIGTVNVNGSATLTVNNDLVLTRKVGTNIPTAVLNIASNATVNVKGNAVSSNGVSTVVLNGLLNLQPAGDATSGFLSVSALSGSGTITNASSVTNTTSITPGTTTVAGTLTIANNLTLATGATLNVNLADTTTVGSGVNDLIDVSGNLNLNNNSVAITPTGLSLATGSYRLFNHSGARTGSLAFTNPTRYNMSVNYGANQVDLVVSGGGPGNLRWAGTTSAAWDLTTSNWFNTGSSATDRFFNFDNVLVDDSGTYTNLLSLSGVLFPNTVTVNSTNNYAFGGSGRISGAASLVKQGTGVLTVSNANDFTGPVTITAGTLRMANGTALGTTNSGTTVLSGGTLDVNGISFYSPGETVTIAGTGANGVGAIINGSATGQNNAIRYVTLSDNASVRADTRWDIRGPGGANTFSGALDLNGFTFTKLGTGQMSIVDSVVTNAGNIEVAGGTMGVTRSIIDGLGSINILTNSTVFFENFTTGYVAKAISSSGGTIQANTAMALTVPITSVSGLTLNSSQPLSISNVISGSGGLTKIGASSVNLENVNTYTGPTTVSAGRLNIGTNGSIASSGVSVGSGAIFDVSAVTGFTLAGGQTLSGSGLIAGDVNASSANGIIPGSSAGTLTFSNSLSLNNSSNIFELSGDPTQIGNNINDLVAINGALNLSGINKIKIIPIAALNNAAPYTLFQYGTLSGSAANLDVQSDSRYTFSVIDPATTVPYIQVQVTGSGTAADLTWKGGAVGSPNAWDTKITANWLNGASPDVFFLGDRVLFDDTATTGSVDLVGTLQPSSVLLNNSSLAYTFAGSGSLVTGSLTNNSGTVTFGNNNANSISAGLVVNGGNLTFANSGANTIIGATLNSGTLTLNNGAANTLSSGATVSGGTLNLFNAAANTFGQPLSLNGGAVIFNQAIDTIFSAAINDTGIGGTLTKQGGNILTLSGVNSSFNGPIVVSSGILKAGSATALGTATSGTTIASGATLDINGQSLYNPGDLITISGSGLNSTGAVINAGAAQNNALRAVALAGNATVAAWINRWDIRGPGGSGSFSGLLSLSGNTLTKLGAGQISLVDCNATDAGNIIVGGGTLSLTRSTVEGEGYINVGNNTLLLENYTAGACNKPLIFSGNGTLRNTGNPFSLGSPITNLTGTLTIDCANHLTLPSPITGSGELIKLGNSNLVLIADNNLIGGTLISAGTLQVGDNTTTGTLPTGSITNNGTLTFRRADNITVSNVISGSGIIRQSAGGTVFLTASNSYLGQTILEVTTSGSALRISDSSALGSAAGNTTINGNNNGHSTLELVGDITVADNFSLSARQAATTDTPHIRSVSGTNTITGSVTGTTGGSQYNIQSDSGKLIMTGGFQPPATAGVRALKLMGDGDGLWSGVITNNFDTNAIVVGTHVVKMGLGKWTLSAANVHFGTTTVRSGTLALAATGSINNSTNIDVQTGATFDVAAVSGGYAVAATQTLLGAGTILGNVRVDGTVAPGTGLAALTFSNNVVLAGTSIMEIDRDAVTNADSIIGNSVTYGGTLRVLVTGASPLQSGDTFNLFDATSLSGSFATLELPSLDSGLTWDTSALASNGTIKVAGSVSTTPTSITLQYTGNTLDLAWPADHTGWRLETQTNSLNVGISTNWFTVPDSITTNRVILNVNPVNGAVFYRLVYP